jgi:pentatricopeptide repeat protein
MRDKEFYASSRHQLPDHGDAGGPHAYVAPSNNNGNKKQRYEDSHWSMRSERPGFLQGMDVGALMDALSNPRNNVMEVLDEARHRHTDLFDSGKSMTAIISAAARRRQIRLAHECWEWMDRARIPKNVYHYNSMISVTEKDKNYREALELLKQMEQKGIAKNEVT